MKTETKVGTTSTAHYNQHSNPSDEVVLVNGYEKKDSLELWIPENLNIDRILDENPPEFEFKKDKMVYILHLIHSIPSAKKDMIDNYTGYTPISREILGRVIKNNRQYVNYLKDQNIVEEDNYVVGTKSRGLRFTSRYRTKIAQVEIHDWCLIKNLLYLRKKVDNENTQKLSFMKQWFSDLTVDIEGAKKYLDEEYEKDKLNPECKYPELRYNSRLLTIQNLESTKSRPLFFVDTTSGRLHTYLTQLKSELRKFVKYKGKTLYSIDIVNSQPYFSTSLLNVKEYENNKMVERITTVLTRNKLNSEVITIMLGVLIKSIESEEDVLLFKGIVQSGKFYEEFGKILVENGIIENGSDPKKIRKIVKEITFQTFFSKNISVRYLENVKIFKEFFPNVYKVFCGIKETHHPTLAIILQNLEADLILHQVCTFIKTSRPQIPLFTLHDSIITTEEHVKYVQKVMQRILKTHLGTAPELDTKPWE